MENPRSPRPQGEQRRGRLARHMQANKRVRARKPRQFLAINLGFAGNIGAQHHGLAAQELIDHADGQNTHIAIGGNGAFATVYDPDILAQLRWRTGSFAKVPGSWKDYP